MFCATHDQLKADDVNGYIMSDATHFHKIYHVYQIYRKNFSRDSQNKNAPVKGALSELQHSEALFESKRIHNDHVAKSLNVNQEDHTTTAHGRGQNIARTRIKKKEKSQKVREKYNV